ncbi:ATP-dependent helicase [Flavobacterium akiainvivens]|uniref:DNA 3'-5' helicase n=1 Tax=Flavobacterium akiainvivens TaxID=1202724 RepID=A0A0M8MBR9_9FLAO|nr:UvrD-helicase domain-containing protein [Flavobacterium akiainvivens]KOS06805.1 ATP-dependent helicase [Flavobacterium akiainvivens]SFQ75329.1 ATP-dependent exoDNAse (exonuclease V) beta subunit (contains helicase and exonuclease domains) [Flavobacterium akiainvivens]
MPHTAFSIYNASAGSGKTYTLVKEYLRLLLTANTDDAYRRILAITFTNKAVEEMKRRIVENLSDFAKDDTSDRGLQLMKVIGGETGLSIATIRDKAKAIIKNIIHNYAAFDISTIDRFTHKVIRAFAHDLNLSVSFDVSLETDLLLQEAVDAIIAKAGDDPVLTSLLVDFSLDKTDNDKSWDVTHELFETGRLLVDENNRNELAQFENKTIADFLFIKEKLKQTIDALEHESIQLANDMFALLDEHGVDHKSFSRGTFTNHLGYIRDNELKPTHKKYFETDDIQVNKTAKDRDIIENLAPKLIGTLGAVYKNYEKKNFYAAFLKNITPLSLLNSIGQELKRIQDEQNVLSISEFNAIIHREIQNQPAPFIYERLGERYRHFFIDEFQDTSHMQWHNLVPLIDNALAGEDLHAGPGTLMLVGDPKQSIYRWRGGRAEQFIELGKDSFNPFSNPDKKTLVLGTNYRSFAEVITFNNSFFTFLAGEFEHEDYAAMYAASAQDTNPKSGGYVNISFISPPTPEGGENAGDDVLDEEVSKDDLYLEATLATIEKVLAQGFELKDIVLLTRKRQPGILLATYLTEKGIKILSSETLLIDSATEVKLILNLLRYLKSNDNREAKTHFLYFAAGTQTALPTHDFIAAGMEQQDEEALEQWLGQHGIHISFKGCRKKSLYEAVESIIDAFIKDRANQSYVQYFLDLVLERDMRTQSGIADFLDYWDKNGQKFSIPSPEGENAVRIMTIHKSKGLEFPVVIFPFAEEDYSRSRRDKLWLELDDTTFEFQKALIDSSSSVTQYGDKAKELYETKAQEALLDNINILYVALTRAEEQLYIISNRNFTSRGELTNNMSSYFIKFLMHKNVFSESVAEYAFGNVISKSKSEKLAPKPNIIQVVKERFNPRRVKIAQRESLMWGNAQAQAIEFGNVVHEVLSFVKTESDIPLALMKAIEQGLITHPQMEQMESTLKQVVTHPDLAVFFEEGNAIYNEQSIIAPNMPNIKPDRVAIRNGQAYLLDYKTGAHKEAYEKQLNGYAFALREMGLTVAKKTIVYISEGIEIVNF